MAASSFRLSDFDFDLPPELIAQHPAPERSGSRLLDGRIAPPADRIFRELPGLLKAGDLLIFNDTQVIKARLFGQKSSGGQVEALIERVFPESREVWAHVRASKSPKPGQRIEFGSDNQKPGFSAEVLGRCGPDQGLFHLRFPSNPFELLAQYGHVPLPPYITHADSSEDERRYQTVFARRPGAVAAPTAALHFDEEVLGDLSARGIHTASITLHVGAGTFQPVRALNIAQHKMHSEWFEVPPETVQKVAQTKANRGRVLAVGTTTLRALESAAQSGQLQAGSRDTDIFITPGFEFRVVDQLITNFHLPKSTLMMLVSAFAGLEAIQHLYQHAISQKYRFFSYGDAMLLERRTF